MVPMGLESAYELLGCWFWPDPPVVPFGYSEFSRGWSGVSGLRRQISFLGQAAVEVGSIAHAPTALVPLGGGGSLRPGS